MDKQSSIEWLWHNLTDDLIGDLPNEKIHEIYNLVLQAKQMHKQEIEDAYGHGQNNGYMYAHQKAITITKENYYSQTYGGNNE